MRALDGPAPFVGSNALAISPDGRNVYVASSRSDAIAIFARNSRTGKLAQRKGRAGCVARRGTDSCAPARALNGPNSVAVSADGRNVYVTSRVSDAVTAFRRNRSTGALTQLRGAGGCVADRLAKGCATGRALGGADVVAVSPDGENVYVGAFTADAVAILDRNPSTGALTQPADATGCVVATPLAGCATGLALDAPEGLAVSGDGANVYVASASSSAVLSFARDASSGALTQAADGSGCIVQSPLAGCTTGTQIGGANAVAVSGGDVYVTTLLSKSLASFTRDEGTGLLTQKSGTSACAIYVLAVGCSLVREFRAPEGVAVSPDGASVYATAFASGAIAVFNRNTTSGGVMQKRTARGCMSSRPRRPGCIRGRGLRGVSSIAVSPDGRFVYSAAFKSDAVAVFKRAAAPRTPRKG
ncbi:MAG: beta-propeller fold lactonase family protein [Solirubrobacterales bacterium]|nr:beta-propeller fold lactonase family protein [Solirubrobacterales bacterium]